MVSTRHGDSRLEAGLLGTREEEKAPFIPPGSAQVQSASAHCSSEAPRRSRKMSPFRRVTLILTISLLVGLGLALARHPSLTTSCMRWSHGLRQGPSKIARTALDKRQDGSLANGTLPASPTDKSKTAADPPSSKPGVVVTSSTPSLPAITTTPPASTEIPSSPPSAPATTPIPASSTSHQPPPPVSTTSTTFPAAAPSQTQTSTTPGSPESFAPTTSDVVPTTTPFEKTITTGRVKTSIPVAHILTTTLENGGTLTITSTSWVAVVPSDNPTSSSQPKLQSAATKSQGCFKLVFTLGAVTLGMLLL
ncbi:hypothetical protein E4U41_005099 [Claviceps citrina]|nr:hypothetical protein E4U41_005099 [Claviceps citrina]